MLIVVRFPAAWQRENFAGFGNLLLVKEEVRYMDALDKGAREYQKVAFEKTGKMPGLEEAREQFKGVVRFVKLMHEIIESAPVEPVPPPTYCVACVPQFMIRFQVVSGPGSEDTQYAGIVDCGAILQSFTEANWALSRHFHRVLYRFKGNKYECWRKDEIFILFAAPVAFGIMEEYPLPS